MQKIPINWSKLTQFTKTEVEKIDTVGGVYRISKKGDDGKYYVFFVGSSENLKQKLLLHLPESETNVRLKNYLQ